MKKLYHCLILFLSTINGTLYGQANKQKTIFLGDTVTINNNQIDLSKINNHFKVIDAKKGAYLASSVGRYVYNGIDYTILDPLKDGVTKVLVIGNSFSDDGVEYYLHEMARSTGKALVIGNLFRGGAPLDFHLKNALTNNKIYSYRKTTIDGIKSNTDKTSILEALKDENWDYICFQQASVTSGNIESIKESLPKLFDYVVDNYPISTVKYLYHQTWAYAQNAVTANFDKYDKDQILMYNKIVEVSRQIPEMIPMYKLIPSGTAIQNGRGSFFGDNFTREAYHLDLVIGRFTAASTWYGTLFDDLETLSFKPAYLGDSQFQIAKESALLAIKNPFSVSKLKNNTKQNKAYKDFDEVRINLGTDLIIPGWTALLYEKKGSGRFDLLDNHHKNSNVNVVILKDFESRKGNGPKKISFDSQIPSQVTQQYLRASINTANQEENYLSLENLNPAKKYNITVISTVAEEVGESIVQLAGAKKSTLSVNPSFNRKNEILFEDFLPSKDGKVLVSFRLPKGYDESYGIINAIIIKQRN